MSYADTITPADLIRCGHIAVFLRQRITEREWSVPDLAAAIGLGRASTTPYKWLKGVGSPGPAMREKLGKLFAVPPETFAPHDLEGQVITRVAPTRVAARVEIIRAPARDVLSFTADSDGQARIRLDVTLPLDKAAPLLRMLLDAGVGLG